MNPWRKSLLVIAVAATPATAIAEVLDCHLAGPDNLGGTVSLYSIEGHVHTIALDYEDDLSGPRPMLFICDADCEMDLRHDPATHRLAVFPTITAPVTMSITSTFRDPNHGPSSTKSLEVTNCSFRD